MQDQLPSLQQSYQWSRGRATVLVATSQHVPLVWGGGLLPSGCLLGPLRECARCSAHAAQFVCPLPTPVGSNISPRPSGPAGEGWRNTQFYSEA